MNILYRLLKKRNLFNSLYGEDSEKRRVGEAAIRLNSLPSVVIWA